MSKIVKKWKQVEFLLKQHIGDEVAIPLILAEEKIKLAGTILQKVENVAKLKEDLIEDISSIADLLSLLGR